MSKTVVVSEPNGNGKQNIEVISKSGIDDGATEVNRKKKIYLPISSDQTLDQHKVESERDIVNTSQFITKVKNIFFFKIS